MASFTGQVRARKTSRLVAWSDFCARTAITFGGIATIIAVGTVCLFLVWVVLPLLRGGSIAEAKTMPLPGVSGGIVCVAEDPYRHVAWLLDESGTAIAFGSDHGVEIARAEAYAPALVSSVMRHEGQLMLGLRDGRIQFCTIDLSSDFLNRNEAPPQVRALEVGATAIFGNALYECTPEQQLRRQQLQVRREEPLQLAEGASAVVLHADFANANNGMVIAAVTADGTLHLKVRSTRYDLMQDREVVTLTGSQIALAQLGAVAGDPPDFVQLLGAGENLLLVWRDGRTLRIDTRDIDAPHLVETLDLLPGNDRVTCLATLLGKSTLLVGDERGDVHSWFRVRKPGATSGDGNELTHVRTFPNGSPSAVVSIEASTRSRLFLVGQADGSIRVWHGTSEGLVASTNLLAKGNLLHAVLSPKEDGVLAVASGGVQTWDLRPGHPEVTLRSVFRPVWYEGYASPQHTWQSTGGTDDFEPKFGLWSLIFGTLKATFYCLLFGVPLALLAAVYTSEFLHARTRARIKPAIELMASLPSVVLGFLAALVFAPIVERSLMTVLVSILTLPAVLLLAAQFWQMAPPWLRSTAERIRLPAALLVVPIGLLLAVAIAPWLERILFHGDIKAWLAIGTRERARADAGSAFGGWLLAALPFTGLLAAITMGWYGSFLRGRWAGMQRLGLGTLLCLLLATGIAFALTAIGWDLRGTVVGTYDQRNSLVVGFVMGFAVIPIVYTIAEDALSAVPEHLRAASLGAGATPWQTAVRIIFPTALSGVFSGVMIGLGRAVGETMIVLMAAGNTPIVDFNIFNGFRTLSANIATELPEAVRDSSHYRMLYLSALCLFAMTFVLNTFAEVVRQRFRKRAFQL
jgi:phosphate transport system permease protein